MPNNFTEHIKLNQWELGDAVRRTDFNEDNAKLDAAVGESLDEVRTLRRVVTNLAYHVGQLSIVDATNRNLAFSKQAMVYDSFFDPGKFEPTGGITVERYRAKLSGVGASGTLEFLYSIMNLTCKRTEIWTHHKGGSLSFTVNGTPATPVRSFSDTSFTGGSCTCHVFSWTGNIDRNCNVIMELNCGSDSSMEVYDYFMAFL